MPQHGQRALIVCEAVEVRHDRINNTERQCVLFVEQHAHEDAVGA